MPKTQLIAGLVIILAIVVLGGIYLPSPNQDISTWPVYENQEYGFRISYPPGWRISEGKDMIHYAIIFSGEANQQNIVDIYKDETISNLTSWFSDNPSLITQKSRTHKGVAVTEMVLKEGQDDSHVFIFSRGKYSFVLSVYGDTAEKTFQSLAFLD